MQIQRKVGATRKHRNSSSRWQFPKMPNWGSFAFGVIVGVILTSLIYFKFATSEVTLKIPNSKTMHHQHEEAIPVPEHANIAQTPAEPPQPQFDFYNELTKESHSSNKTKALDLKSGPKPINGYLVQAGSFKKRADAESLRAELALNNIVTSIETAKLNDGNVWYRVLTGPFSNEPAALAQQKALKAFAKDSIIVHRYAE